jgi:hypothetical protein
LIAGEDWAEIKVRFDSGASGFIHGDRLTGPFPAPVAMGEMKVVGSNATLRIQSDGFMFLHPHGSEERQLPFVPTITGYKGDSVHTTQQHFVDCLRNAKRCESEEREYLRTVALVEDAYRSAARDGLAKIQ